MRTFVRMVCILACLVVLPTVCFAQSQEEWNLSCNYKTSKATTVYVLGEDNKVLEVIPANTYVKIYDRIGNDTKKIQYMIGGVVKKGKVSSSCLVRCSSQYRQPNGMAENVHELDPNHDEILESHDVILVAPSLLQNGEKDYSTLDYELPAETTHPIATATPTEMKSVDKSAGSGNVSIGKENSDKQNEAAKATVQIGLVQLGVHTSVIEHEGREQEVPTAELQFSSDVPEGKRVAYIHAPRTGRCYLRATASDKGDVLDRCPAGTVVQVVKYGKSYCQIVFEGHVGYVKTACLKFADPKVAPMGTWLLSYNGKTTGAGQVPLRSDKSNESAIIVKLRSGTEVTVFSKYGAWYEVEYKGLHGYVHQNFLNSSDIVE